MLLANILSSFGSGLTMIAVPWYITDIEGISTLTMLAGIVALVGIVWMPTSGFLVDRFPRKWVLMSVQGAGAVVLVLASLGLLLFEPLVVLVLVFVFGSLMYGLWYPAVIAYVQELLPSEMHGKANGYLEVQGQVSMMAAGFVGGRLVEEIDISTIFLFDAGSFLLSFCLFALLPLVRSQSDSQSGFVQSLTAGFRFLRKRAAYTAFFAASLVPFLIVMVANAVMPAHISDYLQYSADVFGDLELSWGLGAAAAGAIVPQVLRWNNRVLITVGMLVFGGIQIFFSNATVPLVLFVCAGALGLCNAGIRVVRNTLLMKFTPTEVIGRANTAFFTLVKVVQASILLVVAQTITGEQTHIIFSSFGVLAIVSGLFAFAVYPTRLHSQN